ncbi:MFS transporter [Xanthobacter agilis]|jgi:MFS family permease|uniref:MFS family permease n=1 Tax=Xanthobacter agilis TaxID=47492 RepID=A0ABU0LD72_XANAG|nr:MFS transporter [Xanthobacter agilis]MDQ0505086.1 MFS family permease [Xanthobacter agilis]
MTSTDATADAGAPPPGRHILARSAVIATAAVFGLTYSLSAPLVAFGLAQHGLSEALIGANAAMHAIGVLVTAMLLPRIVARLGARGVIIGSVILSALTLMAFPAMPAIWLWFPLRLLLGMAAEALFVTSETWINALSTESTRARAMAAYTAALSMGLALGPIILSLVGTSGLVPYALGAAICLTAAVFVASPQVPAPHFDEPTVDSPVHYLRLAPLALTATALNAAVETAGLSFLALYAIGLGWGVEDATRLMSVMMIGAIVLQLPIGWLGDTMDRRRLVIALAVASALGAAVWPFVLGHAVATYALLFVWGGAFVGIYTIMITIVGARFKGGDLVGIYAVSGLFWGFGALVGPLLSGVSMQFHVHGLAIFTALACAAFAAAAWRLRSAS